MSTNTKEHFTGKPVLVWITNPEASQRIVSAGKELAEEEKAELIIVSIQRNMSGSWQKQAEDLELLHRAARDVGAELTVVYSDNSFKAATEIVLDTKPGAMIAGLPGTEGRSAFLDHIFGINPETEAYLVDSSGNVVHADILD